MPIQSKVNGSYRTTSSFHAKVDGTWRTATELWAKINGAWTRLITTVPNILNQTAANANAALSNAGLNVGTVTTTTSGATAGNNGTVQSQNPTSGLLADARSSVNYVTFNYIPPPNFPNFTAPNFPNFTSPHFPDFIYPNFPNFTAPNFTAPNFTEAPCCYIVWLGDTICPCPDL